MDSVYQFRKSFFKSRKLEFVVKLLNYHTENLETLPKVMEVTSSQLSLHSLFRVCQWVCSVNMTRLVIFTYFHYLFTLLSQIEVKCAEAAAVLVWVTCSTYDGRCSPNQKKTAKLVFSFLFLPQTTTFLAGKIGVKMVLKFKWGQKIICFIFFLKLGPMGQSGGDKTSAFHQLFLNIYYMH